MEVLGRKIVIRKLKNELYLELSFSSKMVAVQSGKIFPSFYGTQISINMSTIVLKWILF
jgi:hypothetical protein